MPFCLLPCTEPGPLHTSGSLPPNSNPSWASQRQLEYSDISFIEIDMRLSVNLLLAAAGGLVGRCPPAAAAPTAAAIIRSTSPGGAGVHGFSDKPVASFDRDARVAGRRVVGNSGYEVRATQAGQIGAAAMHASFTHAGDRCADDY